MVNKNVFKHELISRKLISATYIQDLFLLVISLSTTTGQHLLMPVVCQAGIRQCFCSLPAFPSVIPRCEWAISTWLLIGPLRGQMGQSPSMTLNKRGHFILVELLSSRFEPVLSGAVLDLLRKVCRRRVVEFG